MQSVKIKTKELLAHLKKNRTNHQKEYQELMVDYRAAVVEALKKNLKTAQKGEDVDHTIRVTKPVDYTSSYDETIAMLEWTTEPEVELERHEFVQYVQDEWGWKQAFTATKSAYGKL
jgi:hypothetical protein